MSPGNYRRRWVIPALRPRERERKMTERTVSPALYETMTDFSVRIPVRSGIQLGATITRPRMQERCPALVWYDPYRGAWDGSVGGNALYFAARGYAFVNLHSRGTGN